MSGLPQWTDLLERARKAGTFVYESVYRRKNGASFPVEINLNLIRIDQEYVVKVVRDITARKAEEARIEHLAYHDPLTGLPNRSLVLNRLQLALAQAQRSGCMLAAIFLDLDRFKTINDTLGHPLGDALLKQAAQRLRQALREGDTVARVGGDEFLVLLPSIGHMEDAAQAARKILAALAPEFLIDGHELSVGASAGVVVCPRDGMDADTLLKHADVALYRAKEKGGNAYRFFDPEMNARAHHRLRVEGGLRHAIERGELEVHYQPQVDLRSGRISGAEALIRWRSAEHGLIPPAEFIPIAEDSGLILPLGEWCLTQACAQARAWRDAGLDLRSVSVNVSARQLRQPDLAGRVRNVLARTGLPATQLELEITESSVMLEDAACLQVLAELRQSGVRIALDDFGTGYSSLAQLRHLPLDRVKIDRSFLTWTPNDRNDAGVVQLIIAIGRQLGLGVVAEGVETRPQLEQLLRWNCDTAQGYFFAEPMAAHALTALLDTRMNWLTPVQQAPGTEREQERFMR